MVFLVKILENVEKHKDYKIFILLFEVKLWYLLGIGPVFNSCVSCGKKIYDYFSIDDGGMVCHKCSLNKNIISKDLSTSIKYLYLINIDNINEEFIDLIKKDYTIINKIVDDYYQKYLDFKSISKLVIKEIE